MVENQEVRLGCNHQHVDTDVKLSAIEKEGGGEIPGGEGGVHGLDDMNQ